MEYDTKPIPLKAETKAVLEQIRRSTRPTPVYGSTPQQAEELFRHITDQMLEGCPLPLCTIQQMRWYVRELSAKFRSRYGYALSFQLELVLRKWAAFGMEPNTMQLLLREVYRQLVLMGKGGQVPGAWDTEAEEEQQQPVEPEKGGSDGTPSDTG